MKLKTSVQRLFKRYFLVGLIVLVPFLVTWKFFVFVVGYLDGILAVQGGRFLFVIPAELHPDSLLGIHVPGLGVLFTIALVLGVGALSRNYFGRIIIRWGDRIMGRIPLGRVIYNVVKQILETYAARGQHQFSKAVAIEYPRKGLFTICFVTGEAVGGLQQLHSEKLINVFVPTTPNPTSGFFLMVQEKEIMDLNISIEDAFKLIVSGGLLTPEILKTHTVVDAR